MIIHASDLTTTPLGAGAVFTGPTVDAGTEPTLWPTRTRPTVIHATAAKTAHGYLVLQESSDGVNFIETRRSPVAADGEAHTFDWPLHLRYRRLRFINGAQAQTAARISATAVRDDGGTIDEREVIPLLLTNTPLGASATFQSAIIDLGPNSSRVELRVYGSSDQASAASGFRIMWSPDGVDWSWSGDAVIAAIAFGNHLLVSRAIARYARVVWVNGANAQTTLRIWSSLISL